MKITITSVIVKKQGTKGDGTSYTIREITTSDGKKYDTYDDVKEGEVEGEVKANPNPDYNDYFKLSKERKFPSKDYTFEKKKVALECAVSLVASGKYPPDKLSEIRDKFFDYLK